MIFVHGFSGSGAQFETQARRLASNGYPAEHIEAHDYDSLFTGETVDDGCRASCVDWYGNARPIFLRGRIFALMGYELVEGRDDDGRIHEVRRVSYAPRAAQAAR